MATKVIRVLAEDVERLTRLSGLPDDISWPAKVHVVLGLLEQYQITAEQLRLAVRQELDRLTGGA